jgi:carboxypeptidase C (cathepsin A)
MEGFASEIGPFVFLHDDSTQLEFNPHSWNQNAHLLFFEAPAGVGKYALE